MNEKVKAHMALVNNLVQVMAQGIPYGPAYVALEASALALQAEHNPLFGEMIAQHPGLREELRAEQAEPGFVEGVAFAAEQLEKWINAPSFTNLFSDWTDRDAARVLRDWPQHLRELSTLAAARPSEPPKAPEPVGEREAFEVWARSVGKTDRDLERSGWLGDGDYLWCTEQQMFEAWCAARTKGST